MLKLLPTILCFLLFATPSYAADDNADLRQYAQRLMDDVYNIFDNKGASQAEKINTASQLIEKNLHLDWMAKYSLGRNRKTLSPAKVDEFTQVYSKFIVRAYSNLTKNYDGERATIRGVKKLDDNMFIVNMDIIKPGGGQPMKVEYLVHKLKQGGFKIADIITEGISILNSQQSEFNSVIQSQGINGLISDLKKKINNPASFNPAKPQ